MLSWSFGPLVPWFGASELSGGQGRRHHGLGARHVRPDAPALPAPDQPRPQGHRRQVRRLALGDGTAQSTSTPESFAAGASNTTAPAEQIVYVARLGERLVAFAHRWLAEAVTTQWGADHHEPSSEVEERDREKWKHHSPENAMAVRDQIPDRRAGHHAQALFLAGGHCVNTGYPELWSVPAWEFEADLYTGLPVRWHTVRRRGGWSRPMVPAANLAAAAHGFVETCAQAVGRAQNPGEYGDLAG